ncbi:MAG: hypothetical protein O7J95_01115 [Planctomycetota bacterium]|nr:hypothetical protein [Planctomycetota bacterium]
MKLGILAESPADEAAVRLLVEAVLKTPTDPVPAHPRLRHRGWPAVRLVLPAALKFLHYRTEAYGLIVVVDSNHAPVFEEGEVTDASGTRTVAADCRSRLLVNDAARILPQLGTRLHGQRIRLAVGLCIPTIEAWLLCGRAPGVNEAAWLNGLRNRKDPYTRRDLKTRLYDSDRPPLALETQVMKEEARRVGCDIGALEQSFPYGFGSLAKELRSWRAGIEGH